MKYLYTHTQPGHLSRILLGSMLVLSPLSFLIEPFSPSFIFMITVLGLCFIMLYSLTVRLTATHLSVVFGLPFVGRSIALVDIATAEVVRNPWYSGWGIRLIPNGWLYNVSGYDAVEIILKDGRCLRIGTDEPQTLVAAIIPLLK